MRTRVPLEMQELRSECGLACLAMVLGYYDRGASLQSLRTRFPELSQGATFKDLARLASDQGYIARGVRAEPEHLRQLQQPAILHWNMDHFVVLLAVKRRGCVMHDPAEGRVYRSWQEIGERFTGIALEVWPLANSTMPDTEVERRPVSWTDLWRWGATGNNQAVWVVLLSLVLQMMALAVPWHVQWTVDAALIAGDEQLIGVLCVAFALLLLCRALIHWLRGLMVVHLGHQLSYRLACRLLAHTLRLPLSWFEQRHVGDIVSRFASLQPLRDWLTQGLAAVVTDAIMVGMSLLLMFVYSPSLAGLVVLVHFVCLGIQQGFVPRLKRLESGVVTAQAAEQSHLMQSVQTMHGIKTFGLEQYRLDQWQALHGHTLRQSLQLQRQHVGLGTGRLLVGGGELILLVYFAAHEVLQGQFSLGMLFAFLSYRAHFTERLATLAECLVSYRTLGVHLQRVGVIWAASPEWQSADAPVQTPEVPACEPLTLRGVTYRANPRQQPTIAGLHIHIEPGEMVAVVGLSGSGKSTLLKLMMGLLQPAQGEVCWGERPLANGNLRNFRRVSACVLQGDGFFSGSILENLVLFERPDMQRVQSCLQQVDMAQALARLPMGLHTRVGDIGQGLSSGQLQRLLLARAIYRLPQYLFLDEVTANLDVSNARQIQCLLRDLTCTRIVVTHDLSFAALADRAFELKEGALHPLQLAARSAAVPSAE